MSTSSEPPRLWRHLPGCFGCGEDNEGSIGIRFDQQGDVVHARVVFDERHIGGPGLAHGGAIMTLLDEVMGSVAGTGERRRVTASMQVDFRMPIELGRPLLAMGWVAERLSRGYFVQGTVTYEDEPEVVRAEARARFVSVRDDGAPHSRGER
jgi:acyl-coenzyme A thioesterase PaaI-like protein